MNKKRRKRIGRIMARFLAAGIILSLPRVALASTTESDANAMDSLGNVLGRLSEGQLESLFSYAISVGAMNGCLENGNTG